METTLALVAIFLSLLSVGLHGFRVFRDSLQEKARENEQVRTHAAGVAAWVELPDASQATLRVSIKNGSILPIRHVSIRVVDVDDNIRHFIYHPVVPPNITLTHEPAVDSTSDDLDHLRASVTFVDSTQRRWHRNLGGRLVPLPSGFTIYGGADVQAGLESYKRLFKQEFSLDVAVKTEYAGKGLREFFESQEFPDGQCDAIVGPHDWIGRLRQQSLLRGVPVPNLEHKDDLTREAFEIFGVGINSDGVPIAYDTPVLYVNQGLFTGTVPQSIEDLFQEGKQFARAGVGLNAEPQGVSFSMGEHPGEGDPFMMWPVLSALGGTLFSPLGDAAWQPSVEALQSPNLKRALENLQDLSVRYPESFRPRISHGEARKLFTEGNIPFHIDVAGARSHMQTPFDVMLAPIPRDPDAIRPGLSAIYGFYFRQTPLGWDSYNNVFASDNYMPNGEDFLHFHLGSRSLCAHLSNALGMPVVNRSGLIDHGIDAQVVLESCRNARPMPTLPKMPAIWDTLGTLIAECCSQKDIDGSIERASAKMTSILRERNGVHRL